MAQKISTVLGPNGTSFARCHFRAQQSLDFQSRLFWVQMALALLLAISGPNKVPIFRAHPFQWLSHVAPLTLHPYLAMLRPYLRHAAPVLSHAAPLLFHAAPLLSHAAPLLCHDRPLLNHAAPLLCQAAPLISYDAPLLSQAAPLISHAAKVVDPVNI